MNAVIEKGESARNADPIETGAMPATETECLSANRAVIFNALRSAGVSRAIVSYCGSGDSGGPEETHFEKPGETVDRIELPELTLYEFSNGFVDGQWQKNVHLNRRPGVDAITDLAMDLLDNRFSGWENDEGASGEVIFEVSDSSITLAHHDYYTESEYTEVRL